MADKKKVETSHLIIGAAIIIIILLGGWFMFSRSRVDSSVIKGGNKPTVSSTTETKTVSTALVVEDQAAGASVKVRSMDLPKGGWVAIKEVSTQRILGAGRFPAGATSGEVPLLRATVAKGAYEAVVYEDDGDMMFDMKKDVMVTGVSTSFNAQ